MVAEIYRIARIFAEKSHIISVHIFLLAI